MKWLYELITNPFLITGLASWFLAQILKTVIYGIVNKRLDFTRMFGDGGMPSGHSATVTSLAIITGLNFGLNSFEFAMAFIFATVVCRDAMGVRLETGKQAQVLNEISKSFEILTSEKLPEVKLKELVGHTPLQVFMGVVLGAVNAVVMYTLVF